jgi:hypothetical protein
MESGDMGTFTGSCSCSWEGETAAVFNRKIRKARKEHTCCECGETIDKGSTYEYVTMLYDGSWDTFKTCMPCFNLGDDIGCRLYGGLGEQFYELFGWNYTDDPADWDDDDE